MEEIKKINFKLKGDKYCLWPVKVNGKKVHLAGGRQYTNEDVNLPFEEVKKQLGKVIVWTDEVKPNEVSQV